MALEHTPLVSVVMPVHNGARYLRQAVESILQQQYSHFELIIVNDGSTDETARIIAGIADTRIRCIHLHTQQGIVAALNTGIEAAQGTYIARMDADDESLPNRFLLQVAYLEAHPEVGILGTQYKAIGGRSRALPLSHDALCWFMFNASPLVHPAVIMRRSLFTRDGLWYDAAYQYAEDLELWTRAAAVTRLANLPQKLIRYRFHQGTHKRNLARAAQLNTRIREQYLRFLFPGLNEAQAHQLAILTNRHLAHMYSVAWFKKLLHTLNGLPQVHPLQYEAYRQCLWFHLASAPQFYPALHQALVALPWAKISAKQRAWLWMKRLLGRH